jgi:hypothetical protein
MRENSLERKGNEKTSKEKKDYHLNGRIFEPKKREKLSLCKKVFSLILSLFVTKL